MRDPHLSRILEKLAPEELIDIATEFEISVEASWPVKRLRDALLDAPEVSARIMLAKWGRDELKDLCRRLGVSDRGVRKSEFVEDVLKREGVLVPDIRGSSRPEWAPASPWRGREK